MSTTETRVKHVYGGLTVKERAILRLRAYKEDRAEDPELYRSTPQFQVGQVDREMAFVDALHDHVAWFASLLASHADGLRLRHALAGALGLWEAHAGRIVESLARPELPEEAKAALWSLCEEAPLVRMEGKASELCEAFVDGVAEGLARVWSELLAVDEVVAWGAERFEGEEPLHPEVRYDIEAVRAQLVALAREVEVRRPGFVLPAEANQEFAEVLRGKALERVDDYRGE